MIFVDYRVAELVVFVAELQHGKTQFAVVGKTQSVNNAACGVVAHNYFHWYHFGAAHNAAVVVVKRNKVRCNVVFLEVLHQNGVYFVAIRALSLKILLLFCMVHHGVVAELCNCQFRVVRLPHALGFAFVK